MKNYANTRVSVTAHPDENEVVFHFQLGKPPRNAAVAFSPEQARIAALALVKKAHEVDSARAVEIH